MRLDQNEHPKGFDGNKNQVSYPNHDRGIQQPIGTTSVLATRSDRYICRECIGGRQGVAFPKYDRTCPLSARQRYVRPAAGRLAPRRSGPTEREAASAGEAAGGALRRHAASPSPTSLLQTRAQAAARGGCGRRLCGVRRSGARRSVTRRSSRAGVCQRQLLVDHQGVLSVISLAHHL